PYQPHISTLSLHDALPISRNIGHKLPAIQILRNLQVFYEVGMLDQFVVANKCVEVGGVVLAQSWRSIAVQYCVVSAGLRPETNRDRKSTRLNSSHQIISYA